MDVRISNHIVIVVECSIKSIDPGTCVLDTYQLLYFYPFHITPCFIGGISNFSRWYYVKDVWGVMRRSGLDPWRRW